MAQFATLAAINGNGTVVAVNAAGISRALKVGDSLQKGEIIRTVGDARVELMMEDGRLLAVAPAQSVRLDDNVVDSVSRPTAQDSAVSNQATADTIIQALERGTDLNQTLEATAAGPGTAGGTDGGSTFVQLLRIAEGVDPLTYNYSFSATGATGTTQQGLLATDTTLQLTADAAVAEGSAGITYTATLGSPALTPMTITLNNGAVITIATGSSVGSVLVPVHGEDVYLNAAPVTATVVSVNGGGFTDIVVNDSGVITVVNDTITAVTVDLSASTGVLESGTAAYTFTATLSAASHGDTTVVTDKGTIVIHDGQTTGTLVVAGANGEDVYKDASALQATITSASGGNFEQINVGTGSATATIVDTVNAATVNLSASTGVLESGTAAYTFTATLSAASQGVTTIVTDKGTITIADGQTTGTLVVAGANGEDVYKDASSLQATITSASGGNFESLVVGAASATATIVDSTTPVTVDLSASTGVLESGTAAYTFTATLSAISHGVTTVVTDKGTITIADGQTTGTLVVGGNSEDVYKDATTQQATITAASGGNFEQINIGAASAAASINDTIDVVTVGISGSASVNEGGTASYTVSLSAPGQTDVVVNLSYSGTATDGSDYSGVATVTIPAGASSASFDVGTVYQSANQGNESFTVQIASASGGNFESLQVSGGAGSVSTTIVDTYVAPPPSVPPPDAPPLPPAENTPPHAVNDNATNAEGEALTTPEDTALTIAAATLTANDTDPDSDTISITSVQDAAHGTVVLNSDGTITFTPEANYNGSDASFTYTVSDGHGGVDTAAVAVNVTPVNDPPATDDVRATGKEGSPIDVVLLGSDGDGTVDHFVISTLPGNGTLYLKDVALKVGDPVPATDGAATVTFKPNEGVHSDTATFTYASVDNKDLSDPTAATATITVVSLDTTIVTLSHPDDQIENGATVTYTVSVEQAAVGTLDLTVSVNGIDRMVTIQAGQTSATFDVETRTDDWNTQGPQTYEVAVTGATGGGYEKLDYSAAVDSFKVSDDHDVTTVSLSTPTDKTEDGLGVMYTVSVDNAPVGALALTVSVNGVDRTVTILDGQTSATFTVATRADDVYVQGAETYSVAVKSATGGNYENLDYSTAKDSFTVGDDKDPTTVNLSASTAVKDCDGVAYTFTATLSSASQGPTTVHTDQGDITILNGQTTGTLVLAGEHVDTGASSMQATITSTSGGNFEKLVVGTASATATIVHDENYHNTKHDNNGWGNGDQDAPGNSLGNNNAENSQDLKGNEKYSNDLHGGHKDDQMAGGSHNDHLQGGEGDDRLTGGGGADTFVWKLADLGTEGHKTNDVITDFSKGDKDKLDINDLLDHRDDHKITAVIDNGKEDGLHIHIQENGKEVQEITLLNYHDDSDKFVAKMFASLLIKGNED